MPGCGDLAWDEGVVGVDVRSGTHHDLQALYTSPYQTKVRSEMAVSEKLFEVAAPNKENGSDMEISSVRVSVGRLSTVSQSREPV